MAAVRRWNGVVLTGHWRLPGRRLHLLESAGDPRLNIRLNLRFSLHLLCTLASMKMNDIPKTWVEAATVDAYPGYMHISVV